MRCLIVLHHGVDGNFQGLRVGYGAFPSELIEYIWRVKQPYNVSAIAEETALAALSNPTYLKVIILSHSHLNRFIHGLIGRS